MKFGRYEIRFGKYAWTQTRGPTTVWPFLCFLIFKEARPWDLDKKPQFPPGTGMEHEGRTYRYWKPRKGVVRDEPVNLDQEV
ncbi:hypothetical protein ES703_115826 [subsurface metagenome]